MILKALRIVRTTPHVTVPISLRAGSTAGNGLEAIVKKTVDISLKYQTRIGHSRKARVREIHTQDSSMKNRYLYFTGASRMYTTGIVRVPDSLELSSGVSLCKYRWDQFYIENIIRLTKIICATEEIER